MFLSVITICALVASAFMIVALNRDAKEAMRRAADAPMRPLPNAPPARIRLVPREEVAWKDEAAVLEEVSQLTSLGFCEAGTFEIEALENHRIWAFVQPRVALRAIVQERPDSGLSVEIVTRYADGRMFTLANNLRYVATSLPVSFVVENLSGLHSRELYQRMIDGRPPGRHLAVGPDEFAAEYESVWATISDWRNLRGGLDRDELRAFGALRGEVWDDAKLDELREEQEAFAFAGLYEAVATRYFAKADLTVSQRYRLKSWLVIIHDRMPIEAIAGAFRLSLDEADSRIARAARSASLHDDTIDGFYPKPLTEWTPRQAFAGLNDTFPTRRRFGKLAELTDPIEADVYAPPGASPTRRPS